ncbi:MAG: hypothetical protein ACI9OU_000416 [Candidatus Promineifilaceae bacterium]|jgi:hypothetical protein
MVPPVLKNFTEGREGREGREGKNPPSSYALRATADKPAEGQASRPIIRGAISPLVASSSLEKRPYWLCDIPAEHPIAH